MSWWVYLNDPETGGSVEVPAHEEGGTYQLGGADRAELNVTYNYGKVYALVGFKLRDLHGRRALLTIPDLRRASSRLGTRRYSDYWAPTPGNAGHALSVLLGWAEANPDAVWDVS